MMLLNDIIRKNWSKNKLTQWWN